MGSLRSTKTSRVGASGPAIHASRDPTRPRRPLASPARPPVSGTMSGARPPTYGSAQAFTVWVPLTGLSTVMSTQRVSPPEQSLGWVQNSVQ